MVGPAPRPCTRLPGVTAPRVEKTTLSPPNGLETLVNDQLTEYGRLHSWTFTSSRTEDPVLIRNLSSRLQANAARCLSLLCASSAEALKAASGTRGSPAAGHSVKGEGRWFPKLGGAGSGLGSCLHAVSHVQSLPMSSLWMKAGAQPTGVRR